jgi:hypothetical protein
MDFLVLKISIRMPSLNVLEKFRLLLKFLIIFKYKQICITTDWINGVRSPAQAKDFPPIMCIQTSSEVHPISYRMGNSILSPGVKRGRGVTSIVDVKNE